jgi:RHS repeat-associated protein
VDCFADEEGLSARWFELQTSRRKPGASQARDYDPATGTWLSSDGLGFGGGTPNLYHYAGSDPINSVDLDGSKVGWSPGTSMAFKRAVAAEVGRSALLKKVLQKLDARPGLFLIGRSDEKKSKFRPDHGRADWLVCGGRIAWNPNYAFVAKDGSWYLSPGASLLHEMTHALIATYPDYMRPDTRLHNPMDEDDWIVKFMEAAWGREQNEPMRDHFTGLSEGTFEIANDVP